MNEVAGAATIVGRYRLLGRLGEGGMGVVHLAEDAQGNRVALKVLRPHVVGDDEGRSRLAREVTSLRRVRSPWVAEVIDADPWGDTPYVVTRYVAGPSLHDLVRTSGPLANDDLTALAVGLAEAVEAVHRVDVIHRDVKPSNVLIEDRTPVLIDFGLARLVDDSRLTISGWLLGTPGYLAPEILHGDEPTTAADMHAWAATLVFAATGRGPYGSGPAVAVMDRIRRGEYDLSGVPQHLHEVLRAALSPDLRKRPTAREARQAIEGTPTDSPTTLVPVRRPWPPSPHNGTSATRPISAVLPAAPAAPRVSLGQRLMHALVLGCMLVLLAAATVLAPFLTAAVLMLVVLFGGAASWLSESVRERQARRGRRASDPWWGAALFPWFVLVALPGALVLGLVAVGAGALVTALVARLAGMGWDWPALASGALAAGLLAWWGPLSRRPREVVRRLVVSTSSGLWVSLLLGVAAALGLLWQLTGTTWWPTSGPPWPVDLPFLTGR